MNERVRIDEEKYPWRVSLWGDEGGIVCERLAEPRLGYRTLEIVTETERVQIVVSPQGKITIGDPRRA